MTVPIPDVNCSFPSGTNNNRDFHIWTGNDAVDVWRTKKELLGNMSCVVVVVRRLGSWWETEGKEREGAAISSALPRSQALVQPALFK